MLFLLNVSGVGVSCRILYSFVVYLYVSRSGSITSVGEERANLSAVVYLQLFGFCSERFPLPLGARDGLRYFIVALPEPSNNYFRMGLKRDQRTSFFHNLTQINNNENIANDNEFEMVIILIIISILHTKTYVYIAWDMYENHTTRQSKQTIFN